MWMSGRSMNLWCHRFHTQKTQPPMLWERQQMDPLKFPFRTVRLTKKGEDLMMPFNFLCTTYQRPNTRHVPPFIDPYIRIIRVLYEQSQRYITIFSFLNICFVKHVKAKCFLTESCSNGKHLPCLMPCHAAFFAHSILLQRIRLWRDVRAARHGWKRTVPHGYYR